MISKSLIALLIALAFFFIAKKAHPIANRSGNGIADQPSNAIMGNSTLLTVATFNIQTGKSADGVRNIQRAASLVNQQHLIGLQEVYAPGWLNRVGLEKFGVGQSQLTALSQNKDFGKLLCAVRRRWFREQRGNAILSRLPISHWNIKALPDYTGKSFRNMTIVEFKWQGKSVQFINTHLHTGKGREEQLEIVLAELAKYPRAILVGDFNSRRDANALAQVLQQRDVTDAIDNAQIDTEEPAQRIDWILTKGFTVESGKVVSKGISDHPYYEVSLALNVN